MAFKTTTETNNTTYPVEDKTTYTVKVIKVRPVKDKDNIVFFSANVNGVQIYDMKFIFYTDSETGEEKSMIGFPSDKYNDKATGEEKFANKAYFPVSDELKADVLSQIEEKLKKLEAKKKN